MLLKIKNIPKNSNRKQIRQLFASYGKVTTVAKKHNIAFVHMANKKAAELAIEEINGQEWNGNILSVRKLKADINSSVCITPFGIMRMF